MTVAILVTGGDRPHAIPISAIIRAGPRRALLGVALRRESLARLREHPGVTLAITATDRAFSADGRAEVVDERLTDGMVAVAVEVDEIHDHLRPTFAIESGVRWHWTDSAAQTADAAVRDALRALADSG